MSILHTFQQIPIQKIYGEWNPRKRKGEKEIVKKGQNVLVIYNCNLSFFKYIKINPPQMKLKVYTQEKVRKLGGCFSGGLQTA